MTAQNNNSLSLEQASHYVKCAYLFNLREIIENIFDDTDYDYHASLLSCLFQIAANINLYPNLKKNFFSADDLLTPCIGDFYSDLEIEDDNVTDDDLEYIERNQRTINLSLLKDILFTATYIELTSSKYDEDDDDDDDDYDDDDDDDDEDDRDLNTIISNHTIEGELSENPKKELAYANLMKSKPFKKFLKKHKLDEEQVAAIDFFLFVHNAILILSSKPSDEDINEQFKFAYDNLIASNVPIESMYFSGTPLGTSFKDYVSMLGKYVNILDLSTTAVQSVLSIFSNPIGSITGLFNISVSLIEKSVSNSLYNSEKNLLTDLYDLKINNLIEAKKYSDYSRFLFTSGLDEFVLKYERIPKSNLKTASDLLLDMHELIDCSSNLNFELLMFKTRKKYLTVPRHIDINKLKKLTSTIELTNVREQILNCYHKDLHIKQDLIYDEVNDLSNLLSDIGYFSPVHATKNILVNKIVSLLKKTDSDDSETKFYMLESLPTSIKEWYLLNLNNLLYNNGKGNEKYEQEILCSADHVAFMLLFVSNVLKIEEIETYIGYEDGQVYTDDDVSIHDFLYPIICFEPDKNTNENLTSEDINFIFTKDKKINSYLIYSLIKDYISGLIFGFIADAYRNIKVEPQKFSKLVNDPRVINNKVMLILSNSKYFNNFISSYDIKKNQIEFLIDYCSHSICFFARDYFSTDKELKNKFEGLEERALESDIPLEALYFSGSPSGMKTQDYLSVMIKGLGIINKASTIYQIGLAIFSLSSPVTSVIGLTSLGLSGIKYLSENSDFKKRQEKYAIYYKHEELYNNALYLLNILFDSYNTQFQYKTAEINNSLFSWKTLFNKESFSREYVENFSVVFSLLSETFDLLNCMRDLFSLSSTIQKLPITIDVDRFLNQTESLVTKEDIRGTVFKYYPKDNEYRLIETIELEEALKIESIFNEIGYFSVSAYVKSKL